jgi:hypothetical protein
MKLFHALRQKALPVLLATFVVFSAAVCLRSLLPLPEEPLRINAPGSCIAMAQLATLIAVFRTRRALFLLAFLVLQLASAHYFGQVIHKRTLMILPCTLEKVASYGGLALAALLLVSRQGRRYFSERGAGGPTKQPLIWKSGFPF